MVSTGIVCSSRVWAAESSAQFTVALKTRVLRVQRQKEEKQDSNADAGICHSCLACMHGGRMNLLILLSTHADNAGTRGHSVDLSTCILNQQGEQVIPVRERGCAGEAMLSWECLPSENSFFFFKKFTILVLLIKNYNNYK
jgi:hypothetical protein